MCFYCCTKRQTINTYLLIITISIFIYSLIIFILHASSTLLYETLENKLNLVTYGNSYSNNNYDDYNRNNRRMSSSNDEFDIYSSQNYKKYINSLRDINSYYYISSLNYNDLEGKSYNILKSLRTIEKSFGITFIIMHIIFFIFIIVFLYYSCGNKEYTLSSLSTFNALNRLKLIFLTLSMLLIFVSLVYPSLLSISLVQYIQFIPNPNIDTFILRLIIGIAYGIFGFIYYIILSCGFSAEKNLFLQLGYDGNPGKYAKYNNNGTPINIGIPASSCQNIECDNKGQEIGVESYKSKEIINDEGLVKNESSKDQLKNTKNALNNDDTNQQVIILSSSKDEKYLYYNGETYMKMNTTINPSND